MQEKIHGLLTPDNFTLVLVDYQPQMAFAVHSIDGQTLVNNAVGLAKAAKLFKVPTILTTVAKELQRPISQLADVFGRKTHRPHHENLWEDKNVRKP
jgi:nicotinamidase-related amidase